MEQRWTIERDAEEGDTRWPHWLVDTEADDYDGKGIGWLTTEQADSLEPLLDPKPTMTGDEIAAAIADGLTVEYLHNDEWLRTTWDGWFGCGPAHIVARVVDPELEPAVPEFRGSGLLAVSADPLPEGVHRLEDDTTWLRVDGWFQGVPDGWTWANLVAWERDDEDGELPEPIMVEVRPVPDPDTEDVRWQDAIGRRLPDGREITGAWSDSRGVAYIGVATESCGSTSYTVPKPDADGMVTVLAGER